MSLGIYDFDNHLLMSDSRAYGGSTAPIGAKRKLHQVIGPNKKKGFVSITSRCVGLDSVIKEWFKGGCELDDTLADRINNTGSHEFIYVEQKSGDVYIALNTINMSGPLEFPGGILIIGSECEYAQGVFDVTDDALLTMKKTVTYDRWSGFPIYCTHIETGKESIIQEGD